MQRALRSSCSSALVFQLPVIVYNFNYLILPFNYFSSSWLISTACVMDWDGAGTMLLKATWAPVDIQSMHAFAWKSSELSWPTLLWILYKGPSTLSLSVSSHDKNFIVSRRPHTDTVHTVNTQRICAWQVKWELRLCTVCSFELFLFRDAVPFLFPK